MIVSAYLLNLRCDLGTFYRAPGGGVKGVCRGQPGGQAMEEGKSSPYSEPGTMDVPAAERESVRTVARVSQKIKQIASYIHSCHYNINQSTNQKHKQK